MKLLVHKNPDDLTLARCVEWPEGATRPEVSADYIEMTPEEYDAWLKSPEQAAQLLAINARLEAQLAAKAEGSQT